MVGASTVSGATYRPGRSRVFDSIVEAVGDTPIMRLRNLPQQRGSKATILAKLEYFSPTASVKDRIGAAIAAALSIGERPESAGKTIPAIVPSFSERYLSNALFKGI